VEQRSASGFFTQSAGEIGRAIDRELSGALGASVFSLPQKVALACRMLAEEGHARTLAGQITARADSDDTFWTTSFRAGFAETSVSNLLRMSNEMKIVEGGGMLNPAIRFHLWIYRARLEINCIVHTHPPYCSALSIVGERLVAAHMDAMMFHEDCAYLEDWPGVPAANEEGRLISEALQQKRSILLAHHGLLTTGKTVEEAVYLAVLLEHAAQMQILARSIGDIRPVPRDLAQQAHDFLLKDGVITGTFDYWARRMARKYPDALS
jgi:L-fuculose-phosphate aldolase